MRISDGIEWEGDVGSEHIHMLQSYATQLLPLQHRLIELFKLTQAADVCHFMVFIMLHKAARDRNFSFIPGIRKNRGIPSDGKCVFSHFQGVVCENEEVIDIAATAISTMPRELASTSFRILSAWYGDRRIVR
jgi:hypothetical protein